MRSASSSSRQLACIMFTDIVGYTLLMGDDEAKALEILKNNRAVQLPIIEKFGGRFIKELGDGILATFSSVTDAVLAAAAMQRNGNTKEDYSLRIGLHMSEVIFENNDVFGDGVNIASRIQSAAKPGGIVISEIVQRNLVNKKGIETRPTGPEMLKNVREAINLYEVVITEDYEPISFEKPNKADIIILDGNSIAVLPFKHSSNDEEQEYFGDGIAEEIIIILSNINQLKVMGRSSSFQYKKSTLSVVEFGRALGVGTILEGSVRRHGDTVRITASLVNVNDGCQMWAERYDRQFTDIFKIQDDISSNIAQKLKLKFFSDDSKAGPVNMEAYELLLKGRFHLDKYIEGFEKAMACFTMAIEIDPGYGEAYAELAKVYFLFTMNLFFTPKEGFEKAKFYAEKALSLNPELCAAHYLLGQINFWYNWDFKESIREFEKSDNCNDPFYFTGVVIDPWFKAFAYGDYEGALVSIHKIIETDPLSFYAQLHLGYFYTFGKQHEKAFAVLNNMLSIVPTFSEAERLISYNYLLMEDNENGLIHAQKAAEMSFGMGWAQNTYLIALAKCGRQEEALAELDKFINTKGPINISLIGVGLVYVYLDDMDKAFDYFNKGLEYRDTWSVALKYNPEFEKARKDPRFAALIKKINYPQEKLYPN